MFVRNKRHLIFEGQNTVRAFLIEQSRTYFGHPSLCAYPSQEDENKLSKRKWALHDWFATASGVLETASSASSLGRFGDAVMFNCNMVRLASQIVSTLARGASASRVLEVDGEIAQNVYVAGTDSHQMAIQNSSQEKSVALSRCKSYPWEKSSQLPFSSDSSSRRTVFISIRANVESQMPHVRPVHWVSFVLGERRVF